MSGSPSMVPASPTLGVCPAIVGVSSSGTSWNSSASERDQDASGSGSAAKSVGSGPTTVSRASAVSRVVRAIGPLDESSGHAGGRSPPLGTRPSDGLNPDRPLTDAGMRIDPPPSEPVASGTRPAATAAAEPPDEPPADRPSPQAPNVAPNVSLTVSAFQPSSGRLVLPT